MKTNHRRGFVAQTPRDQAMWSGSCVSLLSDRRISAAIGNDFTNGNRGMARSKAGAKKFLRSRTRFHENAVTKKLADYDRLDD